VSPASSSAETYEATVSAVETSQNLKELQMVHKALEAENERLQIKLKSLKSDNKKLRENSETIEKEKKEAEMTAYKRQVEIDVAKRDLKNI
jgi:prefoldin subunit 5